MQQNSPPRRSNRDRTAETRARLIAAARALFVEKGYAETGTPEIVAAAGVTRGALYHHFADKADLFRAVAEAEAATVAAEIEAEAADAASAQDALTHGTAAYFRAMAEPGRSRILLLDGPAVLGPEVMGRIDAESGAGSLRAGLAAALGDRIETLPLDALAAVLSAGFDRAALDIAGGAASAPYEAAVTALIDGLLAGDAR